MQGVCEIGGCVELLEVLVCIAWLGFMAWMDCRKDGIPRVSFAIWVDEMGRVSGVVVLESVTQ